jgi:hypothetical protein
VDGVAEARTPSASACGGCSEAAGGAPLSPPFHKLASSFSACPLESASPVTPCWSSPAGSLLDPAPPCMLGGEGEQEEQERDRTPPSPAASALPPRSPTHARGPPAPAPGEKELQSAASMAATAGAGGAGAEVEAAAEGEVTSRWTARRAGSDHATAAGHITLPAASVRAARRPLKRRGFEGEADSDAGGEAELVRLMFKRARLSDRRGVEGDSQQAQRETLLAGGRGATGEERLPSSQDKARKTRKRWRLRGRQARAAAAPTPGSVSMGGSTHSTGRTRGRRSAAQEPELDGGHGRKRARVLRF